ncbi:MAG: hypothetical protein GF315_11520 [candidate division Zixibacteria bacterium]|nr:hypothetical protein [candidate division Zixibacteria bacterium]
MSLRIRIDIKRWSSALTSYQQFLDKEKTYAVFGVSLKKKKFGNLILEHLINSGFSAYGINPSGTGRKEVYGSPESLPERADAAVVVTSPSNTEEVLRQCRESDINDIWFQTGSVNAEQLKTLEESSINAYYGRCLLLYLPSAKFPHNLHRAILRLFSKL